MRAMSEAPAGASLDEELPNNLYSPTGSTTTGLSGGSSLSLHYKGAFCTPPRVFVDYQVISACKYVSACAFVRLFFSEKCLNQLYFDFKLSCFILEFTT